MTTWINPRDWFRHIAARFSRSSSAARRPSRRTRLSPAVERLEDRTVPTTGWAINAGTSANDVAADAAGNVYVTGNFEGALDFDPGPGVSNLTSAGGLDAFVAAYAPDGSFLWAQRIGGAETDLASAIHVTNGRVFVGGEFSGTAAFGDINLTHAGVADGFVARLDADDGTFLGADRFGGTSYDNVRYLDDGPAGGMIVAGTFADTVDFDPGPGSPLTAPGHRDIFLLRLDVDGNFAWVRQFGSTGDDDPGGLATDAQGNSYLAGIGAVTALDVNGNLAWTKAEAAGALGVDDRDPDPANWAVYTAGGGADGGGRILKLDAANGTTLWEKAFARTEQGRQDPTVPLQVAGVAVAPGGVVYVSGSVLSSRLNVDFDPGPGTAYLSSTYDDAFLLALDGDGNYRSVRRIDGAGYDRGRQLSVGNDGTVYQTGYTDYYDSSVTASFDVGDRQVTLNSADGNGFLVKLVPGYQSITGRVVYDANANGIDDEVFGLQGWTVYLDQNNNNQLDDGETVATTAPGGDYTLPHLPAGSYTVAVVGKAGWVNAGSAAVTLSSDGRFARHSFANLTTPVVRTYATTNVPISTKNVLNNVTITIPDDVNILDLDVRLSVSHPKLQNLYVRMMGPTDFMSGGRIIDFAWYGDTGRNFTNTIFDMDASQSILDGSAPYTGRFRPSFLNAPSQWTLDRWDGRLAAGTYTLWMSDGTSAGGTLTDWALLVTTAPDALTPPTVSVDDVSSTEGNTGPQTATFTVSLSNPSAQTVTVNYATADGTATTANNDYTAAGGTLTFLPGQTSQTISVTVHGDTAVEPNETFVVNLSNPTNATLGDAQGVGTILDDDAAKFLVVNDGSPDQTYRYGTSGNAQGNSSLAAGNAAPRGAAANAAGTRLWVLDAGKTVHVYDGSGSWLGSWAAGGLAANAQVEGLATNGTDVWIVDAQQDKVYRFSGAASRLSGSQNATSSFNLASGNGNARGFVTDGASLWVVNDAANTKVFKYTLTGTALGNWTADAANATPTGITLDPTNPQHLWIVDSGTDRVYQYDNAVGRTSGSQSASISFALAAGNTNPQDIADPPAPGLATRPRHKVRRRGNNEGGGRKDAPDIEPRENRPTTDRKAVD